MLQQRCFTKVSSKSDIGFLISSIRRLGGKQYKSHVAYMLISGASVVTSSFADGIFIDIVVTSGFWPRRQS